MVIVLFSNIFDMDVSYSDLMKRNKKVLVFISFTFSSPDPVTFHEKFSGSGDRLQMF